MSDQDKLEDEVSQALTEGEMEQADPAELARKRLLHRYEIRIKAEHDPITKETELYRQMADEVDGRYNQYVKETPEIPKPE
jgi:hypothetical protein